MKLDPDAVAPIDARAMPDGAVTARVAVRGFDKYLLARRDFLGTRDANSGAGEVHALSFRRIRQAVLILPADGVPPLRHAPLVLPHVHPHRDDASFLPGSRAIIRTPPLPPERSLLQ